MSVKCSVRSCAHNNDNGRCFAQTIVVRGVNATCSGETLCKSYIEQSPKRYLEEFSSELNQDNDMARIENVSCSAIRCKYNDCSKCRATHIQINRKTSACDTFEQ